MKPFFVVLIVILTCGLTHSYSAYGNKRLNRANVAEPMMPIYTQPAVSPQQYDRVASTSYLQAPPQYLSVPYLPRITEDYNYNSRNPIPNLNPNYYYYPREDYQTPLYGVPTYRGDYQPKPYSFAQPSYSSDDRIETTNPLDYLHEEILQENERERSLNANAAFMQNLALYNKQVDSIQGRQQQIQQIQDLYNLRGVNDPEDYDIEQPSDWYDQTSILVDPNTFEGDYQPQQQQPQYQYEARPSDYDDEMVKELRDLTKHNRKSSNAPQPMRQMYNGLDWQQDMPQDIDWQQDMPQRTDEIPEQEYDDEGDDWINWGGQKRNIQPKKVSLDVKQTQQVINKHPDMVMSTKPPPTTSTVVENSKLIAKLHKGGQKEVVLPRPATPVRKPFTEPIMKMMKANNNKAAEAAKSSKTEQTPPIYKTIKEIIDMEQNLSHLSNNEIPTSKIRKRFVTNEEALVQQLNGLKRTSK